jgi:hypothetical protein
MSEIETKPNATIVLMVVAVIAIGISTGSHEGATAQTSSSNMTAGQNQTNMLMMGPNITGSIALGPLFAKAIASQVHVSLANASTTAEKAVGANAHAAAVRIGVVHGFLVYMALVIDSSNNFHGVIVDPGNGKVLASNPVSFATMGTLIGGGGGGMMGMMMGPGTMGYRPGLTVTVPGMVGPTLTPGSGMMGPQTAVPVPGMMGPGMSGFSPGMMQHGMMKGPGIMMGHP